MRIGLFGGTFNPVHFGHLKLAQGAQELLKLDQVIWMPVNLPPHKEMEKGCSAEDRYRMVELAIHGHPGFSVSRLELDRPSPSYSIDTVRALKKEKPQDEWFFLLGEDAAVELKTWREIDELMKLIEFVAVPRVGRPPRDLPLDVKRLPLDPPAISASDIRRRIREHHSIVGLVPEAVHRYIEDRRLYQPKEGA